MEDYQQQQASNQKQFMELLKAARSDIWQIAQLIDDYQVNPNIVVQFLHGINSIMESTEYGNCSVEITDGVCHFVRSTNNKKIMESVRITNDATTY